MGKKSLTTAQREEEFQRKLKDEFAEWYQQGYRSQFIINKIGQAYGMSNIRVQNLIKPRKTIREYGIDE